MTQIAEVLVELIPPDRNQCQSLRPNKTWSPFALGPAVTLQSGEKVGGSRQVDKRWRCNERPEVIVTQTESDDGLLGSMSLCSHCFVQLCLQTSGQGFKITEDLRKQT